MPELPACGGCDAWCGLCDDEPLVPDCRGHRAPSGFVGDGYCDAGLHRYDGELIDFNCPEHGAATVVRLPARRRRVRPRGAVRHGGPNVNYAGADAS